MNSMKYEHMSRSSLLRVHGCGLNNHIESSTRRQFSSQSFGICSAAYMNARSANAQPARYKRKS
ncbi:hypothetical protein H0E87_004558, partial [Populus deltoides]